MDIIDEAYRQEFLATFYNNAQKWEREVVCTYKFTDLPEGTAVLDLERSRMSEKKEFPWLTDDSIDWKAWCNINDPDYKSTNRLVDFLVDVVSKNGALLLNITPRADGTIPEPVRERLLAVGDWLRINGEAIYDTRPWKIYGEGPQEIMEGHLSESQNPEATAEDIRFTTKGKQLYATVLDWPGEELIIRSLGSNVQLLENPIQQIKMLGAKGELEWVREADGLKIRLPNVRPCEHAFVLKITL